jgi:hypothetical protein
MSGDLQVALEGVEGIEVKHRTGLCSNLGQLTTQQSALHFCYMIIILAVT